MSGLYSTALSCLCLCVFICGFPSLASAQCPPKTTIADTIYNADGSLAAGRVVIAWPTYAIGSCQVVAGQATVTVTAGAFSVQLYPNDAAVPAGTSYRVTYYLKSGRVTTEYWVVPTSTPPVAISAVRSATVPVPNVMFSQAQVTNLVLTLLKKVELPSPCASGKFLQSNGSATQPQVACVDGTGGFGGGSQHQVNGVNLAANDPVNFQDTSTVAFTNPAVGNVQAAVKDSSITAAKLNVATPSGAQLSGVGDTNIAASALSPNRIAGTAEVLSNKGAASGYAALDASSKVVQDPANAQATPAPAKIPLADGAGKIADGWLSASVSLLGSAIDLAGEVAGTLPEARGGTNQSTYATGDLLYASAANTLSKLIAGASGRYLRMGASVPAWSSVAAAGAGACGANLFVTSANDNAAPTCTQPSFANLSGTASSSQVPHAFLSAFHTDSTPAAATRGDGVFAVGATPTWQRVARPSVTGGYYKWNGTDIVASTLGAAGTGSCTNQFVRAENSDAAPTCASVALADVSGALAAPAQEIQIVTAGCNNATAGPAWDLPTSLAPVATCYGTSPHRFAGLDFADGASDLTATAHIDLPTGWTGNVDLKTRWFCSAGTCSTNNFVMTLQTVCVADAEGLAAPTYNAVQNFTIAGSATVNNRISNTQTNVTMTGCAADETLFLRAGRAPTNASDTQAGTMTLLTFTVIVRRTPQA